mmetsp:Transcript_28635/g.80650  ORF Transcript_28635/g.80650 Transcript_28635/m.80650 type:complete len:183 (+) Transcript_28635:229-777(+)|eukprot:CAMPEP_0117681072 /NCGR_PEP_ID=MMETSP0804-20121206/18749_1 /TAXON_ID=1074897 /ORGANISM="Tetraselmis astigmatica, Strain CCMP880" /LENGTH=182 /DNA_ID=CAMNT_0005490729 /DNA_START=222 /DNA_END=770 /DNA_ORIENTATION=+
MAALLAGVGAAAAAGIAWYAVKLGVFRRVEWSPGSLEGFSYVYVEHKGAYRNIGPKYCELSKLLQEAGVKVSRHTNRAIGIFYDDPAKVDASQLRSVAGYMVPPGDLAVAKEAGLSVATVAPQASGLKAEFPLIGMLSIIVSVMKVYPALSKHCKASGADHKEVAEIYDFPKKKIEYFAFQE